MFRFKSSKRAVAIEAPSETERKAFVDRSKDPFLAAAELKRIGQALDLLQLPELQSVCSAYTASNILSLRLRYKNLLDAVNQRCANELKHIRRALETLVNKILRNPTAYLRLDTEHRDSTSVSYVFSVEQSRSEKQLLLDLKRDVGHRQKLSEELIGISEAFSWLHDQHEITKLSSLALLLTMYIKTNFHELVDKYKDSYNYKTRSTIVAMMEPLALFVESLAQGIVRYPKFYRRGVEDIAEQERGTLAIRFRLS